MDFIKSPKYQNSQKSIQWGATLIHTYRQTDMTNLTGAFCNCKLS